MMRRLQWLRRCAALLLLLGLVLLLPGVARADGEDPEFLPPLPRVDSQAADRLINRYPVWAYTLDGDGSYQIDSGRQIGNRINLLMTGKAWLLKATVRIMHGPLQYSPGAQLADELDKVSGGLTSALWVRDRGPLVTAALVLAGFLAFWAGALRTPGAGFSLLARTTLLLVLASGLLLNLGPLLRGLDRVNRELSTATFAAVNPSGESAIDEFGDAIWQPLVLEPWVQGEFANRAAAQTYAAQGIPGGQWLQMSPTSRQTRFYQLSFSERTAAFSSWGADGMLPRQMLAFVSALLALVVAATGLVLGGGWLIYQVLAVLLLAGAPLLLLVSLWLPEQGSLLLRRWALRLFSLLVLQAVLAFLLGGFVRLCLIATKLTPGGWVGTGLLLAVVSLAVLATRREWLGLLSLLTAAPTAALPGWLTSLRQVVERRRVGGAAAAPDQQPRASLAALPSAPALQMPAPAPLLAGAAGGGVSLHLERDTYLQQRTELHTQALQAVGGAGGLPDPDATARGTPGAALEAAPAAELQRDAVAASRRALDRLRSGRAGDHP